MYRCARVCGLDSSEGLFLFGRKHFYVIDGFTLMSAERKGTSSSNQAKEIKDINTLPEGSHEPLIPAAKGNFVLQRSYVFHYYIFLRLYNCSFSLVYNLKYKFNKYNSNFCLVKQEGGWGC